MLLFYFVQEHIFVLLTFCLIQCQIINRCGWITAFAMSTASFVLLIMLIICVVTGWRRFLMILRILNQPWKKEESMQLSGMENARHLWNCWMETKNFLLHTILGVATTACCEYWRNIVLAIMCFQVKCFKIWN